MNIHCKGWCWSWSSSTLVIWWEEPTHWKRPWCWERLRAGGEGVTEDEMVGWHHWHNGHEFEQTLGDSEEQVSLKSMGITKNQTQLSDWTTKIRYLIFRIISILIISNPSQRALTVKNPLANAVFLPGESHGQRRLAGYSP